MKKKKIWIINTYPPKTVCQSQDDMLDEDRLMLDRSPDDELGSGSNDMDDMGDSGSDLGDDDETETTIDGERVIYPWMQKVHVAGFGECSVVVVVVLFCFFLFKSQTTYSKDTGMFDLNRLHKLCMFVCGW